MIVRLICSSPVPSNAAFFATGSNEPARGTLLRFPLLNTLWMYVPCGSPDLGCVHPGDPSIGDAKFHSYGEYLRREISGLQISTPPVPVNQS